MPITPSNPAPDGHNEAAGSDMLTTQQAARILGLSPFTLNKWRLYGHGLRFIKLGRAVRYRRADVMAYMASRTKTSTRT